jgi:hypothetical protein
MRASYRLLVENPKGKGQLGRPRSLMGFRIVTVGREGGD